MSTRRKSIVSVLALPALVAGILIPSAVSGTAAAHHQASHRAVLVAVHAPAPLDEMRFMTATRLGAVRAEELREERAEARAAARRQHEAILLAARQRAVAVQAARVHVAAAVAVRVRTVAPAVSEAAYSYAGIEALWRSEGGNPAYAATAACIAEAESGGQSWRTHVDNPSQTDYGLFQIGFDPSALNPLTGTQTAIRMSSGGTNWSQWTTHRYCGV